MRGLARSLVPGAIAFLLLGSISASADASAVSTGKPPTPHYCQYAYTPRGGKARTLYLSNVFLTSLYPSSVGNAWQQYIIATYKTGDAAANGICRELSGDHNAQQFTLSTVATSMASAGWKIVHVDWKP